MKTSNSVAKTAALTAAISLLSVSAHAVGIPNGTISSVNSMVQVGQKPTIVWNINFPPSIADVVTIDEINPPKTKVALKADIRTIGQGVTGLTDKGIVFFQPTRGLVSLGGSDYKQIFFGTNSQVTPNISNLERLFGDGYKGNILPANTTLQFGGDIWFGGKPVVYSTRYFTKDGTTNVRTLVAGDTPPVGLGRSNGPTLESFLEPFLTAGKVNIGPMDMIVFMELTHKPSQSTDSGYDFQDLLLLVSFSEPPVAP